jgi:nicotinamidase-related amidase
VTIDPAKSAIVVVDMQNFFISPCLGRSKDSNGLKACDVLLKHAIPAARKTAIRIIWLNWGLTDEEIENMPPATLRAFGFETVGDGEEFDTLKKEAAVDDHGINTGVEKLVNDVVQRNLA